MRLIILIFFLSVGLSSKADSLSIVSYNVNYALINEDISVILDSLDADVVCLQETNAKWELILKVKLQHIYPFMEFRHCCTAGGLAVISKHPITKIQYIENKSGWFPGMLATIDKNGKSIDVLNLHLKPGLTKKGRIGWNAHFKKESVHKEEVREFLSEADNTKPLIILGDLNENRKGKAIKWLNQEHGFSNALTQFKKRAKTWRIGLFSAQFDHILYNKKFTCLKAEVFKLGMSDHLPIRAHFILD